MFRTVEHHVQDTRAAIGQVYQFGHNAWTRVLLGGGLNVTRRHTLTDAEPLVRYDRVGPAGGNAGRLARIIRERPVDAAVRAENRAEQAVRIAKDASAGA